MTLDQAKRLSDILKTLEDSQTFGISFAEKSDEGRNFVLFGDIVAATNIDGNGTRGGWEGEIRLPRDIAIEMMGWLEQRVDAELKTLGVDNGGSA